MIQPLPEAVNEVPEHIRRLAKTIAVMADDIAEGRVPYWILDKAIERMRLNAKLLWRWTGYEAADLEADHRQPGYVPPTN